MKVCEHVVRRGGLERQCRMADGHAGLHDARPLRSHLEPQRRRRHRRDVPPSVRRALAARSGGVCELCSAAAAVEAHHRRRRSQGGRHDLANLLHLCSRCHHVEVHAQPERARALGWLVPSWADPSDVPVVTLECAS